MGFKQTYRDIVHKQPPSFTKKKEYQIKKTIGRGGTGKVVLAIHSKDKVKSKAAIKIIQKETVLTAPELVGNEIEMLKTVKHESIVSFIDDFESKDKHYIVMELATGGDILSRCSFAPIREWDAMQILKQVLGAVQYMHSLGIVHRDLKPENILFRRPKDNDIVITDLGLATRLHYYQDNYGKNKGEGFIDDLPGISEVTYLPGYYGTMGYTAPEVLLGLKQGVKIDSWAIGIITYQMLSTAIPWRFGVTCDEHMMEICTPKIVFQERYWGRKSIGAMDFITGLLLVDPAIRMSVDEALAHPWIKEHPARTEMYTNSVVTKSDGNTYGLTKYHRMMINESRRWNSLSPMFKFRPDPVFSSTSSLNVETSDLDTPVDSNSDSDSDSGSDDSYQTAEEGDDEDEDVAQGPRRRVKKDPLFLRILIALAKA